VEQIIKPAIGVTDGAGYRKGPAWRRHFAKGQNASMGTAVEEIEECRMQLVARDGIAQHSTPLSIPLIDVYVTLDLISGDARIAQ
jgi:hypothetical protein